MYQYYEILKHLDVDRERKSITAVVQADAPALPKSLPRTDKKTNMTPSYLNRLPPELLYAVFSHLSISSLLMFAQTNRANYVLATRFLTHLELAIFPKRIHSVLAFLEEECREDGVEEGHDDNQDGDDEEMSDAFSNQWWCSEYRMLSDGYSTRHQKHNHELHRISRTTFSPSSVPSSPPTLISGHDRKLALQASHKSNVSPLYLRERQFMAQNDQATEILTSRSVQKNLRSLILHLYALHTPALAAALSSLSSLQHLTLNFSHPYIYDTTLPASYWRSTPAHGTGSPIWNSLAGIGSEALSLLRLRNLRSLTIRRAGITSFQLRSWIKQNQYLTDLCFEKVRGVDLEFVNWLAQHVSMQRMRKDETVVIRRVILKDCSGLICKEPEDFNWIDELAQGDGIVVGNGNNCSTATGTGSMVMLSLLDCQGVDEALFLKRLGFSPDDEIDTPFATQLNHGQSDHQQQISPSISKHQTINSQWTRAIQQIISPKGLTVVRGKRHISAHERRKQLYESRMVYRMDSAGGDHDSSNVDSSSSSNQESDSSRVDEHDDEVDDSGNDDDDDEEEEMSMSSSETRNLRNEICNDDIDIEEVITSNTHSNISTSTTMTMRPRPITDQQSRRTQTNSSFFSSSTTRSVRSTRSRITGLGPANQVIEVDSDSL